jgi:simple sugar transport system permease protein
MDTFYFIIQRTLPVAIPLLLVALGGMFSERSGIINIALDGIMIVGGFAGIFLINTLQQSGANLHGQALLFVAIIISGLIGGIFSLMLAFASINMRADQTIVGTALNMIAPALAIFIARTLYSVRNIPFTNEFFIRRVKGLSQIPFFGDLFFKDVYTTVYIGVIILIISSIVLYKTRFGLRLRSCGEHPQAADSVGINVYKIRYAGVIISGVLGGIGGLFFVIATMAMFSGNVAGYGFLALAVMIFGQWKPGRIFLAALFFALMGTISSAYALIPFLVKLNIPGDIYKMVPYIITMIVLAFTSKKSRAPKAEGIPYDKGSR